MNYRYLYVAMEIVIYQCFFKSEHVHKIYSVASHL